MPGSRALRFVQSVVSYSKDLTVELIGNDGTEQHGARFLNGITAELLCLVIVDVAEVFLLEVDGVHQDAGDVQDDDSARSIAGRKGVLRPWTFVLPGLAGARSCRKRMGQDAWHFGLIVDGPEAVLDRLLPLCVGFISDLVIQDDLRRKIDLEYPGNVASRRGD